MKIKMDSTLLQDGKVQLQVQSSGPGILNIRIPWYSEKWECVQNGISIKTQPDKGYQRLCISPGDTRISIDFHVVPRWMGANDQVRADAGKTALMKGPLVYCLEEKKTADSFQRFFVEENTSIEENAPAEELVGNVPTLSYKGIRVRNKGADGENQLYGSVELEKRRSFSAGRSVLYVEQPGTGGNACMAQAADMTVLQINFKTVNVYSGQAKPL